MGPTRQIHPEWVDTPFSPFNGGKSHLKILNSNRATIPAKLGAMDPSFNDYIGFIVEGKLDEVTQCLNRHPDWANKPFGDAMDAPTPLHLAAEKGHRNVVELLLQRGAATMNTQDSYGWAPVHLAAYKGHLETVQLLLQSIPFDTPTKYGQTPLLLAVEGGHDETAEWLLQYGIERTKSTAFIDTAETTIKQTPLHFAAMKGFNSIVELLLRYGSTSITTPDKNGRTPIHFAAWRKRIDALKIMLSHLDGSARAVVVNAPDSSERTPLHFAADGGHTAIVEFLLPYHWDIDAPDYRRWTPLRGAIIWKRQSTVQTLQAVGASVVDATNADDEWALLPVDTDMAAEIRYRVYFSRSLLSLLL